MDEDKKNIDESWKDSVARQKQEHKKGGDFVSPEPDFTFFITTLALQASIALGHIPNPATGKTEQDLTQAKFLIDTLTMLREKTKGNLNSEENSHLENLLYELQIQYVTLAKGGQT